MAKKDKAVEGKESGKPGATTTFASSNWLALQKSLKKTRPSRSSSSHDTSRPKKRRKVDPDQHSTRSQSPGPIPSSSKVKLPSNSPTKTIVTPTGKTKNGESIEALGEMIAGKINPSESQKQPGKYLALDCEMVGIGIDGSESSLARVSIVNFYGVVQLDVFVKQKERVVDYRTRYSGIRERDMIKARPFDEVQKQVAELIKDRVLVGHAVFNDLKALLLSHPRHLTRDTQILSGKHKVVKSKYISLKNLVNQELGIAIQGGEHDSVTDARATMAVFRIHRKEFEKGFRQHIPPVVNTSVTMVEETKTKVVGKRKRTPADDDDEDLEDGGPDDEAQAPQTATASVQKKASAKRTKNQKEYPGGGRKGVSSGLSVIVRGGKGSASIPGRSKVAGTGGGGKGNAGGGAKTKWWKELVPSGGSKGSIRL